MTYNELFDGKCPYTDKPCFYEYDCKNCDVETEERMWAEADEEERNNADSN